MDIDFQRKVDRVLGSLLCRFLSLLPFRRGRRGAPERIEKVLVILLSEMGSLVLAYPLFQRIRQRYPVAAIHVLLFQKNREMLDLLNVVGPQQVFTLDSTSLVRLLRDSLSVLLQLRRRRFDVVLDCELFSRISSIFSFLSGAPVRVGFHPYCQEGLYRGDFINQPVLYNPYQHISRQFVTLVEAIDSTSVPKAKRLVTPAAPEIPAVHFRPEELRAAAQGLYARAPQLQGKDLVLIHPGGGLLPIRAWPLEYYCRLSARLLQEGYAIGIIGTEEDQDLARQILVYCQSPCCVDLTGYTKSVRELLLLFHCASLLVTNDSGPGQFSALTPIPAIVLFGPETPILYGRLDANAVIFYSTLSCSPCITAYNHRQSPCDGDNVCLKRIDPEQVLARALEILARRAPAGASRAEPSAATGRPRTPAILAVEEQAGQTRESRPRESPSYPS